jgi:hypothetical protein
MGRWQVNRPVGEVRGGHQLSGKHAPSYELLPHCLAVMSLRRHIEPSPALAFTNAAAFVLLRRMSLDQFKRALEILRN